MIDSNASKEILTCKIPYYYERHDPIIIMALHEGITPDLPRELAAYDDIWELCMHCWADPPGARPSMRKVARQMKELEDKFVPFTSVHFHQY